MCSDQGSPSYAAGSGLSLSVRDLLSWAGFVTSSLANGSTPESLTSDDDGVLRPWEAYVHGAALVLLDGVGLGSGLPESAVAKLRRECGAVLSQQVRKRCA